MDNYRRLSQTCSGLPICSIPIAASSEKTKGNDYAHHTKTPEDVTNTWCPSSARTFRYCRNNSQNILFSGHLGGGHSRNAIQQPGSNSSTRLFGGKHRHKF